MNILKQDRLTKLPVLKIKGNVMGNRVLGSNVHDTYVLGKDGGLHYLNIQGYIGTEYGEMSFDVEEDEEYGGVFESWNFFELMEHDAKILKINDHFSYKELKKALRNLFTLTLKERERRNKEVITNYLRGHRC